MKDYVVPNPPAVVEVSDWQKAPAFGTPNVCLNTGSEVAVPVTTTKSPVTTTTTTTEKVTTTTTPKSTPGNNEVAPPVVATESPESNEVDPALEIESFDCTKQKYYVSKHDCRKVSSYVDYNEDNPMGDGLQENRMQNLSFLFSITGV